MALQGGHRFAVSMDEVFPFGVYALGVEQAQDYDASSGRRTPTRDKKNGDQWVWTVTCIDRDPEAREKEVKVKVSAPFMPVLPPEVLPNSGLSVVEFVGLTATPYVQEGRGDRGRARLALSFRASGVQELGTAAGQAENASAEGGSRPARQGSGAAEKAARAS